MTALLEFKQKLKNLYGRLEPYLLPVFKFGLALVYFMWINENMGYMTKLNSVFVIVILALICCILPPGATAFVGFCPSAPCARISGRCRKTVSLKQWFRRRNACTAAPA